MSSSIRKTNRFSDEIILERTHQEKVGIISKYHILKNGVQDSIMFPSQITPQMKVHEFFNILQMSEIERNKAIDAMEKEIEKIVNKQNKDLENEVQKIKDGLYDIIMNSNTIVLKRQYPFFPKKSLFKDTHCYIVDYESVSIFNEHIYSKINHLHYDKNIISERMNEIIYFQNKLFNDKLLNDKLLSNKLLNDKKENRKKINFEIAVEKKLKKIKEKKLKEERAKEQELFKRKVEQEVQRRLEEEKLIIFYVK